MSNPIYKLGTITVEVNEDDLERNRLVSLGPSGVDYAVDGGSIFGAVTEKGAAPHTREPGDLRPGYPDHVAVHTAPAVVPIESDEAADFQVGDPVYATGDGDGKATKTGSTVVGFAISNGDAANGVVEVRLITPVNG